MEFKHGAHQRMMITRWGLGRRAGGDIAVLGGTLNARKAIYRQNL